MLEKSSKKSANNFLIYALGGGWGHLVRAIALGKVLQQHGRVYILTNSNYWDRLSPLFPELVIDLVPHLSAHNLANSYRDLFQKYQINYLIVDTFPRGILGELVDILPELTIPKILIARDLQPSYIRQYELKKFIDLHYSLCIPIETVEFSDQPPISYPITICGASEILELKQAQKILGIENPVCKNILICPSGTPSERQLFHGLYWELKELLPSYRPNCNVLLVNYFPAMALYSAIDLVIGGGGYNTVGECLAMNLPLLGIPFSRRYDHQALRLERYQHRGIHLIKHPSQVLVKISALLQDDYAKPTAINFINGADEAIDRLLENCP